MTISGFDSMFNTYAVPALNEVFLVTVQLKRGNRTSSNISARREQRNYDAIGQELGIDVKTERRWFRFPKSECLIDGDLVVPQQNDLIIEGAYQWKIRAPDDTTPAVSKEGEYNWLVHCQLVT